MKQYKIDLLIFLGLISLVLIVWIFTLGQDAIEIQLHDTYFVIDKISIIVLMLGPLAFLIFLTRGLTRKFKSIGANVGLIIGLVLISLITYRIIELQKGYLNEIIQLDDERIPDRGQFYADMKNRINWTWAFLGLWLTWTIVLAVRSVRLWKEVHSR